MELLGTSTLRPPFCYGGELFAGQSVQICNHQTNCHQRDIQQLFCGLAGVDICIQDFSGENIIRIREKPKVSVGHIARGISEQV